MFQLYVDLGCVEDFDEEEKMYVLIVAFLRKTNIRKFGKCLLRNIFAVPTKLSYRKDNVNSS